MSEGTTESRPALRYRFGVFEADAATGELRRKGLRVKLHSQPFQVLLLLLERPGELLTREEIASALWPDGAFVDFDHGLNSAINRIREALGDSAANPRFIETLARRGYRFLAPVERVVDGDENSPAAAEDSPAKAEASPSLAAAPAAEPEPIVHSRLLATPQELPHASHRVVATLFALFQLMYLAFYVGALANLAEIEDLLTPLPKAELVNYVIIVTAAILIPARAFVLCAALFRAPAARKNLLLLWPFLFVFDELWSLAPFLLLHHIVFGLALAATALLVYSPFAQRSLVLMGAADAKASPASS
jgi:DNA-binding winged helix-turn-helix (wHTH) protein